MEKDTDKEITKQNIIDEVLLNQSKLSVFFNNHKFVITIVVILIVWTSLLAFWFVKTDEITRDPCSICAEKLGEDRICYGLKGLSEKRIYYANGSIEDIEPTFVLEGDLKIDDDLKSFINSSGNKS